MDPTRDLLKLLCHAGVDVMDFIMSVADLEQQTTYTFGLSQAVAPQTPDLSQWPTRIVTQELLGKLPYVDTQWPHVQ